MNFKMNRLGRFATAALATAMLAGVMATSAFADNEVTDGKGITRPLTNNTFTIEKVINVSEHVKCPDVDVSFTVNPDEASENETTGSPDTVVYVGVANAVKMTTAASFDPSAETKPSYSANATFTVYPEEFTAPGIYKYTVTETDPSYEGMTPDNTTGKTLYVYVKNATAPATGFEVYAVSLVDTNDESAKSGQFTNTYKSIDDEGELGKVEISKTITGDAANMSGEWGFTFTVTGQVNTEEFEYVVSKVGGTKTTGTVNSGTVSSEIMLGNGDKITIYGLSASDRVSVAETDANTDSYATTAKTDNVKVTLTNGTAPDVMASGQNHTVAYTNKRESVTPTGIVMNVAPYAAMIAVAVAGCFVFLRRRREDQ